MNVLDGPLFLFGERIFHFVIHQPTTTAQHNEHATALFGNGIEPFCGQIQLSNGMNTCGLSYEEKEEEEEERRKSKCSNDQLEVEYVVI